MCAAGEKGPDVCQTVYESFCTTRYKKDETEEDAAECKTNQIEKCYNATIGYSTERRCYKWPNQICNRPEKKVVMKYQPETRCEKVLLIDCKERIKQK